MFLLILLLSWRFNPEIWELAFAKCFYQSTRFCVDCLPLRLFHPVKSQPRLSNSSLSFVNSGYICPSLLNLPNLIQEESVLLLLSLDFKSSVHHFLRKSKAYSKTGCTSHWYRRSWGVRYYSPTYDTCHKYSKTSPTLLAIFNIKVISLVLVPVVH